MSIKESDWTPVKKKEARRVLSTAYGIIASVYRKKYQAFPRKAVYIDLHAGDGGIPRSPGTCLSSLEILRDFHDSHRLPFVMYLYEQHNKRYKELLKCFEGEHYYEEPNGCLIKIYHESNKKVLDLRIPKASMGIVYADPYGSCDFVSIFIELSHRAEYKNIDFLFNVSCASIKRVNGCHGRCDNCFYGNRLSECLSKIEKQTFKLREPQGKWQWSLGIFTNASEKLFDKSAFAKHGWLSSAKSWERINQIALTRKEIEELNGTNGTLFN